MMNASFFSKVNFSGASFKGIVHTQLLRELFQLLVLLLQALEVMSVLSFSLHDVVEALLKNRGEVCDGLNSLHLVGLGLGDGHVEELRR